MPGATPGFSIRCEVGSAACYAGGPMSHSQHRMDEFSDDVLASYFLDAFANYVGGEFEMDGASLATFLRANHADATASRLLFADGSFAALAFITCFDARSRLTAMGVAAERRRQGIGEQILVSVIKEAMERGDTAMVLEVIEQNQPAVALYRKHGFEVVRRLCGWLVHQPVGVRGIVLAATERGEIAKAAGTAAAQNLPWQIALPNLYRLPPNTTAYRYGDTYAAVTKGKGEMVFETLFSEGNMLNVTEATDCLHGLFAIHPGKDWRVPVRFPEDYAAVFESFAAQRQELTQLHMQREF